MSDTHRASTMEEEAAAEEGETMTPPHQEDVLRFSFVEMLFALALGQVAIHVADVVGITAPWQDKAPAIAHLWVSFVLIAASWVGWRQSGSPGMKESKVEFLFSRPFFGLLLDVLLVIFYFIIVRHVELEQKAGNPSLTPGTAVPEASWICIVFVVYAFWDLVADVFSSGCIPPQTGNYRLLKKVLKGLGAAFVSVFASGVCIFLSYRVYVAAAVVKDPRAVIFFDLSLVCVILLFRALKAFENVLAPRLSVGDCKAFLTPRKTQGTESWWSGALFAVYLAALLYGSYAYSPPPSTVTP
jgi:hypothetical protein